jgi:hypothetical protein
MELQNYLTITTPDALNAIPDQLTPYPLAMGSRHSPCREPMVRGREVSWSGIAFLDIEYQDG